LQVYRTAPHRHPPENASATFASRVVGLQRYPSVW
jgi:hypothetical protein